VPADFSRITAVLKGRKYATLARRSAPAWPMRPPAITLPSVHDRGEHECRSRQFQHCLAPTCGR
jgi:hypothetical protein